MSDNKIYFHDTTFRDGAQSLWAMYVNYGMWEAIGPLIEQAGYESTEMLAVYPKFMLDWHKEAPFTREKLIEKTFQKTPLMIPTLGMMGTLSDYWTSAMLTFFYQFVQKVYKGKVKKALLICCTRDEIEREFPILFPIFRSVGIEPIPYITYGIREWLTDEYYGSATKKIADKHKPVLFVLKDVDGLLTPERARTLIPAMIKNANGIPIELHSHGMSGFNEAVAVEAMKQGIRRFHTCIPPLASGSSHLNIFNVCHNARVLGLEPCINEEPLREASERLFKIAKEEDLPIGAPTLYDERVYKHEVPGGVISNLESQLKGLGMVDKMDEVLAEIPSIIKELGSPLMITPHSQFIVTQATMNVAMGRWEQFIDGMIEYAMGIYGVEDTGLADINQNLKDKLLSDPRAKALGEKWTNYLERRDTETIEDIKVQYGMENASDEDLFLKIDGITEADLKLAPTLPPPKTYSF